MVSPHSNPTHHKFPPRRGRVLLRQQDSFYAQGEVFNPDPDQLPQFLPRTDWPADPSQGAQHRPHRKYNNDYWPRGDRNITLKQRAARVRVDRGYPQLMPMPPYLHAVSSQSGRSIYNDSIWQDHVAILHGLLRHTLRGVSDQNPGRWLDGDEITELLTCMSYGMNQSMAYFEPWTISGPPRVSGVDRGTQLPFEQDWVPEFGMEMKVGAYHPLDLSPDMSSYKDEMRKRILGRRWLVAPINQFESHWIISLFDRLKGQLYIFDPAGVSRGQRIEATVHLWARFWNSLDMPFHFQYFVPSVTEQLGGWECGLLCVHWILMTLRNRVGGEKIPASDLTIQTDDFQLLGQGPGNFPLVDSDLYIPDWMPLNCRAPRPALLAVIRLTRVLVCNELGLKDEPEFQAKDGKGHESPFKRIVQDLKGSQGLVRIKQFFTGHGGLQSSQPLKSKPMDYDGNAHVHRVHHPTRGTEGVIDLDPKRLATVPPQPLGVRWPDPVEESTLEVTSMQQDDNNATATRYPVQVDFYDRRYPNRVFPPLTLSVEQWQPTQGANQIIFYEFLLRARFPNQPAGNASSSIHLSFALPNAAQPAIPSSDIGSSGDLSTPSSPSVTSSSGQVSFNNQSLHSAQPAIGSFGQAVSNIESLDSTQPGIGSSEQASFGNQSQGGDAAGSSPRGTKRAWGSDDEDGSPSVRQAKRRRSVY